MNQGSITGFASAVVAVAMSVMVWLVATQAEQPMLGQDYPPLGEPPLAIEFTGLDPELALYAPSARTARISLRGVAGALDRLAEQEFHVVAGLSRVRGAGTAEVRLEARCVMCARQAMRIAAIDPPSVTLEVARRVVRSMPVRVDLEDAVTSTCRRVVIDVDPPSVNVTGAEPVVARVERVAVDVGPLPPNTDELELPGLVLVPQDLGGVPVADIQVVPVHASVLARAENVDTCAEAVVLPNYNVPPEGYQVMDIIVTPAEVELEGPPERLEAIRDLGAVYTLPIDIAESQTSVEQRISLDLPEGVTAVGAPDGVTVTIRVSPLPGTRTFDVAPEVESLPVGLEVASVGPSRLQVLLSGPLPLLNEMSAADVRAVLDLSGLEAGTHRLRPRFDAPAGVRVRSATPGEVEVRLGLPGSAATPAPGR